MCFKSIHQPSSHTPNLFRSCDSKKHNFSKTLCFKRSKDTTSYYSWLFFGWLDLHNDHSFMLAIHYKLHNVMSRHFWELFCNNVFKINEMSHTLQRSKKLLALYVLLIIFDYYKLKIALLFFIFNSLISFYESQASL